MSVPSIIYLMYHELEIQGRGLCSSEPGYERYVLLESEFREQIEFLKAKGCRGLSVGQALTFPEGSNSSGNICITFDDGSETDLLAAAPILQQAGFGATFHITVGWLGKPVRTVTSCPIRAQCRDNSAARAAGAPISGGKYCET